MTDANLTIDYLDGCCPVQGEGHVDGIPFCFRARGKFWTLSIGDPTLPKPHWFWGQRYSDKMFAAGFMDVDEARIFLLEAIERFRSGASGNLEAYQAEHEIDKARRLEQAFEKLEEKGSCSELVARYRNILKDARAEGVIPDTPEEAMP